VHSGDQTTDIRCVSEQFDIAIIGAGPAGSTTAIALHGSGLRVALIDRDGFPRDKICGDAISPDVVNQLRMLPLDAYKAFEGLKEKITCNAVRFVSPDYSFADLKLDQKNVTGYVCTRMVFDAHLFALAQKSDGVSCLTGVSVKHLTQQEGGVMVELRDGSSIKARMVVGADGANSVVNRQLLGNKIDRNHHCAGLRQYWEGVTGFSEGNAIELHFYKELLPGYFWVFPLEGNRANVGLGVLSAHVSDRKLDLKKLLEHTIAHHPNVKERFKHARPLEEIKGFGLPLGSKKRTISGDAFLLTGDAASLINPLSGEGIANAIRSGRVAADHLRAAFAAGRFDANFNKAYDREIYRRMWKELELNYWIQRAMRKPWLCNFIVKRAIGSQSVQDMVMSGFNVDKIRRRLFDPRFYLKLFR
jgi:geranylgeranyl reductase family protein